MTDDVTLAGRLDRSLGHAWLEVDGRKHTRDSGTEITLALDDGTSVAVLVTPSRLGLDGKAKRETWGDVAATPLARQFDDVAPGDHVEVELGGWSLDAGTRVVVRGAVKERALVGGGPRDAATAQPSRIEAHRLAVVDGDDATAIAALDRADLDAAIAKAASVPAPPAPAPVPEPPRPPVPWKWGLWITLGMGAVFLGVAVLVWKPLGAQLQRYHLPWSLLLASTGGLLVLLALVLALSRPPFECAVSGGSRSTFHPTWAIGKAFGVIVSSYAGALLMVTAPAVSVTADARWAASAVVPLPLTGLGFAIWLFVKTRRHLRLARTLWTAPRQPDPLVDGKWGRLRGIVRSPDKPPLTGEVSYRQRSRNYTYTSRNQDGSSSLQSGTKWWKVGVPDHPSLGAMRIESGSRTIDIAGEAWWGAPLTYQVTSADDEVFATRAAIADGDEVVVLGRVRVADGVAQIRATGAESLLVFSTPAALGALTARWLAGYALLLATIVASAAATIGLWTWTP